MGAQAAVYRLIVLLGERSIPEAHTPPAATPSAGPGAGRNPIAAG